MTMLSQVPVVDANLATVCLESALYGIFIILFLTSTGLTIVRNRYQKHGAQTATKKSTWLNPMFMASVALALTVTAVRKSNAVICGC